MTDVVVTLPVEAGEEAQLFGSYMSRFIESRGQEAEQWADINDAPYVIIRSEPLADRDLKVIIFQQRHAARAFSRGWAKARTELQAKA